jgi:hypothetical protein
VTPASARALLLTVLAAAAFRLTRPGGEVRPSANYDVYLGGTLSDEAVVTLSVAAVSRQPAAVFLLDSPGTAPYVRSFLAGRRVIPVGRFAEGRTGLESRLGVRLPPPVPWDGEIPVQVRRLYDGPERAVVCPAAPRGQFLQAACLAGTLHAPLFVAGNGPGEPDRLRQLGESLGVRQFLVVGGAASPAASWPGIAVRHLHDAAAVAAERKRELTCRGRVETVVVTNPADAGPDCGGVSALAPLVALVKGAPLLLTGPAGDAEAAVLAATRDGPLRDAESVLIVADLRAVPMVRRPNPIPADKDPVIEMEPLTPHGSEPFSFATGRLFHEDRAVVPLLLARQALLARCAGSRRALVASNVRGDMGLLEAFSRNTVHELRNAGYETTALYGKQINAAELRRLMPEHDVFLWEGHHNPLMVDFGLPGWDEPLPPALVFLQSCLALKEGKAGPLLCRGAIGVVGSSTRTYSASGGACSLAFFDALLYDDQTLGGALRQSKNFLLAYSLLKEKRLGKAATRSGANLRSAWAFTLWGDPTLRLPRPAVPANALTPVHHEVRGDTVVLHLPPDRHERVTTDKYCVEMPPNGRLAGLVRKGEEGRSLAPLIFAEIRLTDAKPGRVPRLRSKLPADRYVFCWDARRRCGYLLAEPGPKAECELHFCVEWTTSKIPAAGPGRGPS